MPKVLVPLAQGCEELEAVTIIDILRRANVMVVVAGLVPGPVTASRGVVLQPDVLLEAVEKEDFDMIVLPGGLGGTECLEKDERVRTLLHRMTKEGRFVAAICAAPRVLAEAGLLEGKEVACYPGVLDGRSGITLASAAVVRDGLLITSRGPGTAMDFALTLVETLCGHTVRQPVEAALKR